MFETLLVVRGRPVELVAHLRRLAASVEVLYGEALPRRFATLAVERARGAALGRLRLDARPGADGLEASVAVEAVDPAAVFPEPSRAVTLVARAVAGGWGAHKWADRSALAEDRAREGTVALLVDGDGSALEATRASVLAVRDDTLLTPPLDGRILAGVARRRLLELADGLGLRAREERLTVADLQRADEVLLSGSVRGVEPVRSVDGAEVSPAGPATRALAEALRRRWLGDGRY